MKRHRTRGDRIAQYVPLLSGTVTVTRRGPVPRMLSSTVFMLRREDGCAMARRERGPHLLL